MQGKWENKSGSIFSDKSEIGHYIVIEAMLVIVNTMEVILLGYSLCIILTVLDKVLGDEYFEILDSGRKYSWKEASQECWTHGGTLPNWTLLSLSQENKLQKLLNGSDTWTSLQLVNGYIQEVTTHTSFTKVSNILWEQNSVWSNDSCVKLTAKHEFEAVKCSTHLSAVCQLQQLQNKNLYCNEGSPPVLRVEVSGTTVNVEHGKLNIRESEQNNVSFHCKATTEMSAFDWIKDGVYINTRGNVIYPARTVDLSTLSNSYSTQGTYWCEAWIPGCAKKYHSNKINLKFIGVTTIHLNLKKEEITKLNTMDILRKLKTLIPLHARGNILDFDVRRGYTSIEKQNVSTYNFNVYVDDKERGMEFSVVRKKLFRKKRQSQPTTDCPKFFELQDKYCYKITKNDTWTNAYQSCFQNGIEKTPLDVKNYWLNQKFIGELIQKNVRSIWLAAERKVEGGPIYYSGPVGSDFNYNNYSAANDFNVSWKIQDFNLKKKCLVLNITQRILDIVSCEEQFPFVCLFPSEFWTQNITYDSFYEDEEEDTMTWIEARMLCKQSKNNDLINKDSARHNVNIKRSREFTGIQNSALITDNQSQIYSDWINYDIKTDNLFQKFIEGFAVGHNNNNKIFVCIPGVAHMYPRLNIKQVKNKNNTFLISAVNTDEISLLYGIKCYLNGKIIDKDVHKTVIELDREGYLSCEALSHTPVQLITSSKIHINFPDAISFVCEIFLCQEYSFQLHDLTFHSEDVGGVLFYEKLLKEKLNKFNVTVLNVTETTDKSGINIQFYIEVQAKEDQISHYYNSIYNLLQFKDKDWVSKNVTVNYLRNTEYCISEIEELSEITGCNINITWSDTLLNDMYECTGCNKLWKRYCNGTFTTGAKWEQLLTFDIPDSSQIIPFCNPDDVVEKALNLLNVISNTTNSTTEFINNFEKLLYGNMLNERRNVGNSYVTIYSSTFTNNVHGYFVKESQKFSIIESNRTSESDAEIDDAVSAVYLNFNNDKDRLTDTAILLTLFQNSTVFPLTTDKFSRLSPVILINISNIDSLSFPIHVIHSIEYEDKMNSSQLVCGYWNETTQTWEKNKADKYEGKTKTTHFNCTYNHLTCFALLVHVVDEVHEAVLSVFTQIGCYLSLTGLSFILTAFIVLRRWRDKIHDMKILFSLSFSLFVMYLLFLTGINQSSVKELCIALGASLHYFILTSFSWMLVVAYHNYLKFYKVVGTYIPRFMMKASLGAWIIPIIPIIIILSINPKLYTDDKFCWIHTEGFYFGFLLPVCFIWLLNLIVFILILYNICVRQIGSNSVNQQSLLVSQVVLSFFLFVMLGLSWVFGFLALAEISVVFSYLFCIITTSQGFLIFVFFILLERKVKDKWIKLIRSCFRSQEQVSGDSRSRKTSDTELLQQSSLVSHSQE